MAQLDNSYSRFVAWAKIILPLIALGLLSTMFLVARVVDPAQELPFAEVDVDQIARQERISKPNYSGMTRDGAAIALAAERALPNPDNPRSVRGTLITAGIDLPTGERVDIASDLMQLDQAAGTAHLRENVRLQMTGGYRLTTGELAIALDRTRLWSNTPTQVQVPQGQLSADTFSMTNTGENNVLVFKGDVKLVYHP